MKKWMFSAVALSGILLAASCTKQYNEKPIGQNSNGNGNNGGVNDGSDPNDNTNWNWTGTAPVSCKVNGQPYQADSAQVAISSGVMAVFSTMKSNNTIVSLTMSANVVPGRVYVTPAAGGATFQSISPMLVAQPISGKFKIIQNNATTLEGYFWANTKGVAWVTDTAIALTQGYFKVTKP